MKTLATLQIILWSIMVVLAGCAPKSIETSQQAPAIEISAFPSTIKIDDISIDFTGYQRDAQYFTIVICFDPPSEEVWHFDDVVLKINNQEYSNSEVSTGSGLGRADGFDCGYIYYPNELIPQTGKAELSIGRLQDYLNRKSHRLEDCNRAQRKLDTEKTGIVISCDPAIVKLDSRFFVVTKKPIFMSEEDADLIAFDAFSDNIQVNWNFSFLIYKP